jgi:hypothetical protein
MSLGVRRRAAKGAIFIAAQRKQKACFLYRLKPLNI